MLKKQQKSFESPLITMQSSWSTFEVLLCYCCCCQAVITFGLSSGSSPKNVQVKLFNFKLRIQLAECCLPPSGPLFRSPSPRANPARGQAPKLQC